MRRSINLTNKEIDFIFDLANRIADDRTYSTESRNIANQLANDIETWNKD